jgi:hypothetical protein
VCLRHRASAPRPLHRVAVARSLSARETRRHLRLRPRGTVPTRQMRALECDCPRRVSHHDSVQMVENPACRIGVAAVSVACARAIYVRYTSNCVSRCGLSAPACAVVLCHVRVYLLYPIDLYPVCVSRVLFASRESARIAMSGGTMPAHATRKARRQLQLTGNGTIE